MCFLEERMRGLIMVKGNESVWPDLPQPVSNNSVTSQEQGGRTLIFSLLGIGSRKTYDAITNAGYFLDTGAGRWSTLPPVPGPGRLASTAQSLGGRVYLFGGYTVNAQGTEHSLPNLDIYSTTSGAWTRGVDIPVPVDDSFSGVYRDRYIYLISGWSETDNVPRVQLYDVVTDTWQQATPIPGRPVFGHAGAIVGDEIIYCDGVYRSQHSFSASNECWRGDISPDDPTRITWARLLNHPGAARYRIAAGADPARGKVWFVGGTDNPYNYDGLGYNGRPSEPSQVAFAYDVRVGTWQLLTTQAPASMDHRGLIVVSDSLVIVGGMEAGQRVSAQVRGVALSLQQ
jgi:N-acetylneuraminic acid mutarotase